VKRIIRLGAVGYLNARPLVYGLERQPRFDLRYDIPSECARLLHSHAIDVGLIPSIEYLRGAQPYLFVPGPAVTSCGPVASVAIYTRVEPSDIRSIAMDTSSRTSVALSTVLLQRAFGVAPEAVPMDPDLDAMLARADAALIIGDNALFLNPQSEPESAVRHPQSAIRKLDLGALWTESTGLPFVYAVWAGWPGAIGPDEVVLLQRAGDLDLRIGLEFPGQRQFLLERFLEISCVGSFVGRLHRAATKRNRGGVTLPGREVELPHPGGLNARILDLLHVFQ